MHAHRRALLCDDVWRAIDAIRPAPVPEYVNVRIGGEERWWDAGIASGLVAAAKKEMIASGKISIGVMWRLCLLEWQHDRGRGDLWEMRDEAATEALAEHDERIGAIAEAEPDELRFREPVVMAHLPVTGIADAVDLRGRRAIEYREPPS